MCLWLAHHHAQFLSCTFFKDFYIFASNQACTQKQMRNTVMQADANNTDAYIIHVHCAYTSCTSYLYLYFIAWFYSTDLRLCFHPRPINHFHSLHRCMQCLRFSMIIVPKTPPILSFSSSSWGFRHCLLWVRGLRLHTRVCKVRAPISFILSQGDTGHVPPAQ